MIGQTTLYCFKLGLTSMSSHLLGLLLKDLTKHFVVIVLLLLHRQYDTL